jgi:transcriptional regulator with GAF, ATPase, and Fis domain
VDCFDAVREDRQYRKGMTREQAIEFLMTNSGAQYDPRVVGTFITHLPEFEAEIRAHKDVPMPTFGIEPVEQLSEAAREVAPAAGLAETMMTNTETKQPEFALEELRALYTLVQSLHKASGREELVTAFVESLFRIAPYDTCAVTLAETESGDYRITHAAGEHAGSLIGRKVAPGEGVSGWVLANRHPFCNTDPRLDLPPTLADRFASYRTLAVFPIIKNKELYGTVALYSAALSEYDSNQQRLLTEASGLLALALSGMTKAELPETREQAEVKETTAQTSSTFKAPALSLIHNATSDRAQ